MYDSAFTPRGPTFLVATTPVQVVTTDNTPAEGYRIRNLGAAAAYIGWSPVLASGSVPTITVAAPGANASANTMGMLGTSIETFTLPPNAWFQASAGASFEITPGEGQ